MLFETDLSSRVFCWHKHFDVDELVVLSGYVGFAPVKELEKLPLKSTVIYGMYGEERISEKLHRALKSLDISQKDTSIFYSSIPVHSKCYLWKKNNKIVTALIGSANFSMKGLTTDYREVLAETTSDSFKELSNYVDMVLNRSISCLSDDIEYKSFNKRNKIESATLQPDNEYIVELPLTLEDGTVPINSGINWGCSKANGSHVAWGDAEIRIRRNMIETHPKMFPPKKLFASKKIIGAKKNRENDVVEFIWDDGTNMVMLFEGNNTYNGIKYPKQICSSSSKKELGIYLRNRLGVSLEHVITAEDLSRYGRKTITLTMVAEGIYEADFSVK